MTPDTSAPSRPAADARPSGDACPAEIALDDPRLQSWRAFLFAQAAVLRELEARLVADADLSLAEYDALVQLAMPEDRRLRMSELADRLVISRSGVTRLVDRLESHGLVRRSQCAPDGRGAYAVLTHAGLERLRETVPIHLRHVEEHFLAHVSPDDLDAIGRSMTAIATATGRCVTQLRNGLAGRLDDDPALRATDRAAVPIPESQVLDS